MTVRHVYQEKVPKFNLVCISAKRVAFFLSFIISNEVGSWRKWRTLSREHKKRSALFSPRSFHSIIRSCYTYMYFPRETESEKLSHPPFLPNSKLIMGFARPILYALWVAKPIFVDKRYLFLACAEGSGQMRLPPSPFSKSRATYSLSFASQVLVTCLEEKEDIAARGFFDMEP